MDAATLRVLVEVNGVLKATQELRNVDRAGASAGRSAIQAASDFDQGMDAMGESATKAARDVDVFRDSAGRLRHVSGRFATDAERMASGLENASEASRRSSRDTKNAAKGFSGLVAAMGGGGGVRNAAKNLDDFGKKAGGATATIGGFKIAIAAIVPMIVGFGGAAVAAGSSLGPLIGLAAAAGNAFAAAAQGVGVFKLAIMGIGGALKEQISNQSKAGGAAASNASAQRSAARAIQSAQEGVADSSRALADAQREHQLALRGLAPAYTEARRALVDMQAGVRDAILNEASLALGLRDARKALDELIQGASPLDIADAQDAVADSTRNTERAVMDLSDAQKALNAVLSDPASTADDVARSRLALKDAENAVSDARRDAVKAAMDLAEIEKPASSDALAEARLRVAQAENDLVSARRDRVRQQKDLNAAEAAGVSGSKQVVEARQAVADAERAVSDARRNVARSQQSLGDAQASANDAMAKGAAGATAMNEEFNKLPPAAQAFVRVLQGMKPKLDELRATAASGFFPGATEGLKAAMGSFSSVNKVVGETSEVLGDAARKSGELVGSPAFGKDIEKIGGNNAKVLGTLGEALRHVVSALRHVMVAAGPLTQWLADMANKWALNAATAAKAGRENGKLAGFFEKTRAITERLASIIGHVSSALLGVGKAGKASGDSIWASIDRASKRFDEWANSAKGQKELKDFFARTKELAAALVPVIGGVASALALMSLRMLPLTTALKLLGPFADEATVAFVSYKLAVMAMGIATKAATAATWLLNVAMNASPIMRVVMILTLLVGAFVLAYRNSETFRDIVTGVWNAIKVAAEVVWTAIKLVFEGIIGYFSTISEIGKNVIDALVGGIKSAASAVASAATWIKDGIVNGVKAYASIITGVGGWIIDKVVAGVKAIGGFASDVGSWVKDKIVSGIHALTEAFSTVGGWIVGRVLQGVKNIAGFAADVGTWIKDKVVGGVKFYIEAITGIGGWVIDKILAGVKAVAGFASEVGGWIKDRVVNGVKNIAEKFLEVGGDIIRGIAKGIENGAGAVLGAIKDAVNDAWNWVKKKFKIKSPSLVFAELGKNLSLGLAQGINSEAAAVTRAMASITQVPDFAGGAIGALGYVTPPASPYGSPNAPLSASEGMSREDALIASNNRLANRLDALLASGVTVVTIANEVGSSLGNQAQARSMTAGNPNTTAINY